MASKVITPGQPLPFQEGEFKSVSQPNLVSFALRGITPPSEVYLQRDDQLGIAFMNSTGSDTVVVSGRFLRANDGVVVPFTITSTTPSSYSYTTKQIPLGEGYILSATIGSTICFDRGQCFASLYIQRGRVVTPLSAGEFQLLCQGYITTNQGLAWPNGQVYNAQDGVGHMQFANVSNPGAGADFSFSINSNAIARVRGARMTFTASATVANRTPVFFIGNRPSYQIGSTTAITAGQAKKFFFVPGISQYTDANGDFYLPCPEFSQSVGNPSAIFQVATSGIQAGDQWSAITIFTEEWLFIG
jgi:hypothetical protein